MSAAHRSSRPSRTRSRQQRAIIATPSPSTTPAAPASSYTSSYANQLHAAILATREAILTEHSNADANRSAALGGLDVTRRTFADARFGLKNAVATRAVTAFLDQKLGDANETGLNTVALSENANTEAQNAATTMNDAASSIKAAAAAVETVIVDVNGIAGVTNANDRDDPINRAAHEAVLAVAKLGKSVDELKCLALIANVQAASPKTGPVVQATQANQNNISNLLATFDAALKSATSAVGDAQTARTSDLNDLFNQSEAFTVAASDDHALGSAITIMDRISNDALTVTVKNSPSTGPLEAAVGDEKKAGKKSPGKPGRAGRGDDQAVAGFKASWDLSEEIAKETVLMTCFAVPLADAQSFDFQSAVAAYKAGNCESYPPQGTPIKPGGIGRTGHVILQKDSNGDHIQFGEQYRIFALRTPDEKHGPQTATQFSFPTPQIASTVLLTFPAAPQVYPPAPGLGTKEPAEPLPHNAFVAIFPAATPLDSIAEHRLFFAPVEVIEREKDAELIIADALNAAAYSELTPTDAVAHPPADLARKIWHQVYSEVPSGGKRPPPVPASLENWIKQVTSGVGPFFVVYFSPFATTEGQTKDGYFVGRYTDMYGDLFDLDDRAYEAYVLAVGDENPSGDGQKAANVLSAPSAAFPYNVHVPPLPTDANTKPSKE